MTIHVFIDLCYLRYTIDTIKRLLTVTFINRKTYFYILH